MHPFLRWFFFTLCLVIFTGVMVWISLRTLDLEAQRKRTAEDAQVQEKVRLALWRMDSVASALLIRENSRPVHHYQAFYAPEDLFASATLSIPKGQALMPSPLFGTIPDLVQLHFEEADGNLTSPQAPAGSQRELATNWYVLSPQVTSATEKLSALGALLKRHPEIQATPSRGTTRMIEIKPAALTPRQDKDKAKETVSKDAPQEIQIEANKMEQAQRGLVLSNSIAQEKKEASKPQLKKILPITKTAQPNTRTSGTKKAGAAVPRASSASSSADQIAAPGSDREANADTATRSPAASGLAGVANRYRSQDSLSADDEAPRTAVRQALPALAGDLQAVWMEKELLLVRRVTLEGRTRLQGVWLDWPLLQKQLLDTVQDLLPAAHLQPVSPEAARTDATALVTLPVRLVTGNVPVTPLNDLSALKPALLLAWACLVAAALAIAFVLHRAVLLSERRGAFVSAVTHELRTPLTTFRLYSEMLADNMVPDPAQRRSYLQTLCDESTRLMHLVENVLAFSRIERGRTAGRMENINVQNLLDRILPRLKQRTDQVGLEFVVDAEADAANTEVKVDAMAVEQILFNLTDNACKYAAPDCEPRTLEVTVKATDDRVTFTLRDHGPGLPASQKRRLFQPFSKSATEAAHSAPGVGLGLALSRRLSRELGGDLVCQAPAGGRGVVFQLTVKKA